MNARTYRDPQTGRPWQLSAVPDFHALSQGISGPSPEFVLFLAADTSGISGEQLAATCEWLLRSGVGYACAWGPGAGRLESSFDEAAVYLGERAGGVLMTTSHEEESLEEAAWFATHAAFPHPAYKDAEASVVLVTVGNAEWQNRLASFLAAGAPMLDEA